MKIKKKDLRRGLAQLPINYPDPDVLPDALLDLGGVVDVDKEMCTVEAMCKQLGHNELAVRQEALRQVPQYIRRVLAPLARMEAMYEAATTSAAIHDDEDSEGSHRSSNSNSNSSNNNTVMESEIQIVIPYVSRRAQQGGEEDNEGEEEKEEEDGANSLSLRHRSDTGTAALPPWMEIGALAEGNTCGYYYHNLTEGLIHYREKAAKEHRLAQQRSCVKELKQRRVAREQELANQGKYGTHAHGKREEGETTITSTTTSSSSFWLTRKKGKESVSNKEEGHPERNPHRQKYDRWISSWADVELILLKLCRGLFFCLWHCDKPLEQLACADLMAELLSAAPTSRGQILLGSCFFRVLSREWAKIDHYRMDKYLALVRRLFQQLMQVVQREWKRYSEEMEKGKEGRDSGVASLSFAVPSSRGMSGGRSAASPKAPTTTTTTITALPSSSSRRRRRDEPQEEEEEKKPTEEAPSSTTTKGSTKNPHSLHPKNNHDPHRKKNRPHPHPHPARTNTKSLSSSLLTARGIVDDCLRHHLLSFSSPSYSFHPFFSLYRVIHEIVSVFQVHLIPNSASVGMTMHLCDISFDELSKAFAGGRSPAGLFAVMAAGIPLYAMSQGNGVEKRVLDHFFPPIAAGMLMSRRVTQFAEQLREQEGKCPTSTRMDQKEEMRSSGVGACIAGKTKNETAEEKELRIEQEASALAMADVKVLLRALLSCCQSYAVCLGTVRVVRVMFSEAELALRQALDPEQYEPLSPFGKRQRIEKEIEEVCDIRQLVAEERRGVREAKRGEKKKALEEKVRDRREALWAKLKEQEPEGEEEGEGEGDVEEEQISKKRSSQKNKKHQEESLHSKKKGVQDGGMEWGEGDHGKKTLKNSARREARSEIREGMKKKISTAGAASMRKQKPSRVMATGLDRKSIIQAIKQEEAEAKLSKHNKKSKVVRNTKRKKHYHLTQKDFLGSDED